MGCMRWILRHRFGQKSTTEKNGCAYARSWSIDIDHSLMIGRWAWSQWGEADFISKSWSRWFDASHSWTEEYWQLPDIGDPLWETVRNRPG